MSEFTQIMTKLGADMCVGLRYLETENYYKEILYCFLKDIDGKFDNLSNLIEKEMWDEYGILAHAIKSNVRVLGVGHLFDIALAHENGGKSADKDFILDDFTNFRREFMTFKDKALNSLDFSEFDTKYKEKKSKISDSEYTVQVNKIRDAIDNFDSDEAMAGLDELLSHELDCEKERKLILSRNALMNFEYQKALTALS